MNTIQEDQVVSDCLDKVIMHLNRNIEQQNHHDALSSKLVLMRTYIRTELMKNPMALLEPELVE